MNQHEYDQEEANISKRRNQKQEEASRSKKNQDETRKSEMI